jgi:hypothetical protein
MESDDYRVLTIGVVDDSLRPEVDGLLYPIPSADKSSVVWEENERREIEAFDVRKVSVFGIPRGGELTKILGPMELPFRLYLTDSRLALACSKYEIGGTWYGMGALVGALNAVERTAAAVRRHGKMLVGHVRYQWVAGIHARPRTKRGGFLVSHVSEATVRVGTVLPDKTIVTLELEPKDSDAMQLACRLVRRVARHRLGLGLSLTEEQVAELRAQCELERFPDPGNGNTFGNQLMPGSRLVSLESARLGFGRPSV